MKRSQIQRKPKKEKRPSLNHQDRQPDPVKKPAARPRAKKLKPVSDKRREWLKEYATKKKELGPGPHHCPVCNIADVMIGQNGAHHHPRGRRTKEALLDFFPVHNSCHDRIHAAPSWAIEKGFLKSEYRKPN